MIASARREHLLIDLKEKSQVQEYSIDYCVADVVNAYEMEHLANHAIRQLGKIDILVYASGTNTPDRSMKRLTPNLWEQMVNVNLNGAYYITNFIFPFMRKAGCGYLIYISSIGGLVPDSSGAAYQASKRGLLGLAHAIRLEEKENGIRTCVICPGLVATELVEKRPIKTAPEILGKALQPEDIADLVLAVAKLPPRAVVPELQVLPSLL